MVSGINHRNGRVGGGEVVEHGNVTPPSNSSSQSSKDSLVS